MKPDDALAILLPAARYLMGRDGELMAVAFPGNYKTGVLTGVDMSAKDATEKRARVLALRSLCRISDADWVVFLSEAWTIVATRPLKDTILPSQSPDRQECVLVIINERGQEARLGMAFIDRSGPHPTFGDIEWKEGSGIGQFTDLLG